MVTDNKNKLVLFKGIWKAKNDKEGGLLNSVVKLCQSAVLRFIAEWQIHDCTSL